jgi:hypothetical protein
VNQANVLEDAEVFGDGRLLETEGGDDIADRALVESEKRKDVAAAWLGNGIEGIRGGRSARHGRRIHSHIGICQAKSFEGGGAGLAGVSLVVLDTTSGTCFNL